jgi:rhodanese-related sulfurtransferase
MAHKHSAAFIALVDEAKSRVREVTVAETMKRLAANPNAVLIDVREDSEWQAGHAAPAKHLGKGIIERDIEEVVPDRKSEVILYCGGGFRSALAGDALQKMGYTNVASMAGGWRAWNSEGAPTSR